MNVVTAHIKQRIQWITFTNVDFKAIDSSQDNLVVIMEEIENFTVMKALVD